MRYYDIHSHVLPGMDDGPKDLELSLKLVESYMADNAKGAIATPHFSLGSDIERFLKKRGVSMKALEEAIGENGLDFKLKAGAEVMLRHKDGAKDDYDRLGRHANEMCLGESNLLLVEYPVNGEPLWFEESLYRLQDLGFQPVLAHMERYSWLKGKKRVEKLADQGIYLQVNVSSLKGMLSPEAIRLRNFTRDGLISFVATDAHSADDKKPMMARADSKLVAGALGNSERLFNHKGNGVLYL